MPGHNRCLSPPVGAGNSNLVYTIIRKRTVFHQLANLSTEHSAISRALTKRGRKFGSPLAEQTETTGGVVGTSMEGSSPAAEAEPGTLKATLAATPGEREWRTRAASDAVSFWGITRSRFASIMEFALLDMVCSCRRNFFFININRMV